MNRAIAIATLLTLTLAGCGGGDGGASGSDYDKKKSALAKGKKGKKGKNKGHGAEVVAEAADEGLVVSDANYSYDPTGKRDPFRSYILERAQVDKATRGPLEQFDLAQLDLAAVIWDAGRERALIRDPSGRGYFVGEGTPIGKNSGRVVEITDGVVVVEETYENHLGERTKKNIEMRIRHSQGG